MTFLQSLGCTMCVVLTGCVDLDHEDSAIREQLVEEGVILRVEDFKARQWRSCIEKAQSEAIARADSTLRAMARQEAVEPIAKPPKPDRPDRPAVKELPDSLKGNLNPYPEPPDTLNGR